MTSEMSAFLPILLGLFLKKNANQSLTISRTANDNLECIVLTNLKSKKLCLLGNIPDPSTGENKIAASMINIHRWKWALDEGFNGDEILQSIDHPIFEIVSPGDLHNLLS